MSTETKTIPDALYPCKFCRDEYTWAPDDLHWSDIANGWVCNECWDCESMGEERGIRLDQAIAQRVETELATERAKVEELRDHLDSRSIHTHSVNCDHPACVFRRERDQALTEVARLREALEKIHDMAGYPRECATDLIGKEFAEAELRERIVSEAHKALSTS